MTISNQTKQQEQFLTKAHHDYEKGMNTYTFFKVHNHAMSRDLVQDTFIKTWAYITKGGNIETVKPFLYHILNHLIIDEYRKKKVVSLDVLIENGFQKSSDQHKRVVDILDGRIAILLIGDLSKKYAKVMHMRYAQDLSVQEISHITRQSKNAVTVRLSRGLVQLRALYNHK